MPNVIFNLLLIIINVMIQILIIEWSLLFDGRVFGGSRVELL